LTTNLSIDTHRDLPASSSLAPFPFGKKKKKKLLVKRATTLSGFTTEKQNSKQPKTKIQNKTQNNRKTKPKTTKLKTADLPFMRVNMYSDLATASHFLNGPTIPM